MKRVYKFGTGDEIPEGAVYLYSREEKAMGNRILVWHYFLVETA